MTKQVLRNERKSTELNLGRRKVSTMNYSKVVTLPRAFTENYLDENRSVSMSLTPDGKLVLTPVSITKKKGGQKS
jgi:hypothetical protein